MSLLQYMKYTTLENLEVTLKDYRIVKLDEITYKAKKSREGIKQEH